VHLLADATWPLPPLGLYAGQVGDHPGAPSVLHVSDQVIDLPPGHAMLRPPSLVLGVGASRDAGAAEVAALVAEALRDNGLSSASVAEVVSIDLKADEPGIVALAAGYGVPYRTFTAHALAAHEVPSPSEVVRAETGTPSVAEAGVLQAGARLVVTKRKNAVATVAVGRRDPVGRLAVIGIGPGARDLMVPRAVAELRRASVVVGLDQYVEQVRDLLRPGTRVLETGLGSEEERARTAVAQAQAGQAVAIIGSGDAGVYAMASPTLEALEQALAVGGPRIEVVGVPGVTAALAASSSLGAALGNDHAYVSLSDLHTPWPAIERRLRAVAEGDLVACLYNPRSKRRTDQLPKALAILAEHRPPSTPVGVVRNASRPDERVTLSTIADLDPDEVDMYSVVIIGCSQSRVVDGHLVTPRGYRWLQ
jgi:cobalt-precorrin 5A hydrolase / precorrin-3B C17-methyltransferase